MNVYEEGLQILDQNRITYIKYSQIQNVVIASNNIVTVNLRTSTNIPKSIHYMPIKKYVTLMHSVLIYINEQIKECESQNNIEILQTKPRKVIQPSETFPALTGYIHDERTSTLHPRERQEERAKCTVYLKKDFIEIIKEKGFLEPHGGRRQIYYQDIQGVELDQGYSNALEIYVGGTDKIVIDTYDKGLPSFYQELSKKVNQIKQQSSQPQQILQQTTSDADELLKWHELLEKGIITQEEFETKKRELL